MSAAESLPPEGVHEIPIADIHVIPGRNPRRTFDEAKLQELAEDIGRRGVLQNLIGRPRTEGGVELVVGERRLRASKLAGRKTVPSARAEASRAEHSRRAEKAAKTRIKNRIARGVCPCCKRTFQNLAAHMQTQHPGFGGDAS